MADTMRVTDGTTTINFSPEDGYIKPDRFNVQKHEALSGKGYLYKFFKKGRWELPLDFFNFVNADTINDWRDNLTELTFYPDMINKSSISFTVRIWNDERPLNNFHLGSWEDKFRGILLLREM